MYLVGLTGGIGSGKSTVARLLGERGSRVIDADELAREVVQPGEPALDELADRFGAGILHDDGTLDRAALARLAFADEASRAALDRITHPRIAARMAEQIARIAADEVPGEPELVIIDHPLLVETGQAARFDAVVVVLADQDERVRRLCRRGMDEADARRRVAVQADDDARRAAATYLIDNDGDEADLREQVEELHAKLCEDARRPSGV